VSLDDDPILLLPSIDAGHEYRDIACDICLRGDRRLEIDRPDGSMVDAG
jgi:hypothetical protein